MNDFALTSVLLSRAAVQPAPVGVPATVTNLPPEFARAAAGSILHGLVSGHDASGHPLIQTPHGTLTLKTNLSLAAGSQITMQLRSAGSQLHVSILQVDGRPVTAHTPQTQPPAPPPVPPTAAAADPAEAKIPAAPQARPGLARPAQAQNAAPAPPPAHPETQDILALGQRYRAVVQSTASQSGYAHPAGVHGAPPLKPGAIVEVRILGIDAPALAVRPPASQSAGGAGGGTGPSLVAGWPAANAPAGPTGQQSAVMFGTALAAKPLVPGAIPGTPALVSGVNGAKAGAAQIVTAAGNAAASPSSPAQPGASSGGMPLAAMVARGGAPGQTLVTTPAGVLALEIRAQLPPGTRLAIELFSIPAAPGGMSSDTDGARLLRQWSVLEESLRALMEAAPVDRQSASIPQGVAQPGARLASGTLFFLSALAAGDLSAWLGQKSLETLTSLGRSDLLTALSKDFAQAGRLFEAAGSDWRFVSMPLFDGQKVQPLRFFFRRGGGQGKDTESQQAATRFIVEVELSRLGDLQLDGLVRPRRFDLILRTRSPLPHHMRRDIAAIYGSANEIGGTSGQIAFQANQSWSLMPLDVGPAASDSLVI